MYAIFQIGNKQYYALMGQIICIDRIIVNVGDHIEFDQVLVIKNSSNIQIGNPFIKHGKIVANVLAHNMDHKIKVIKFHRRKHFRKCQGHRQCFTQIKITKINDVFNNER